MAMVTALGAWSGRRWSAAVVASLVSFVAVALPTAMIRNPVFGRSVGVTWWSWPVLAVTAVLSGMLFATYVRNEPARGEPAPDGPAQGDRDLDPAGRRGVAGGFLTFFAVGCPVCNKVVLLALGYTGALRWFAPFQPVLAGAAVILLGWALRARLDGEVACPVAPGPGGEAVPAADQPAA